MSEENESKKQIERENSSCSRDGLEKFMLREIGKEREFCSFCAMRKPHDDEMMMGLSTLNCIHRSEETAERTELNGKLDRRERDTLVNLIFNMC
jgi:hypothetical protein